MTKRTVASVALALIEERGWWRGPGDTRGGLCIVTACNDVFLLMELSGPQVRQMQETVYETIASVIREQQHSKFKEVLGSTSTLDDLVELCINFNDDPATTKTVLRRVMREASRRLRFRDDA